MNTVNVFNGGKNVCKTLNSKLTTIFVYSKSNLQKPIVMDHTKINLNNFLQPAAAYKYRISGCCLDCLEGFIAFILSFNVPITKLILMNWNDNFMQGIIQQIINFMDKYSSSSCITSQSFPYKAKNISKDCFPLRI